jgi:hypothetical protein
LRDQATIAIVESDVSSISTSAYEQYSTSYTFPATVSTTGYYRIGIYFHGMVGVATSSEMFRIKDVQLEEGSVATPFEHRSYGEELALCQRYYWRHNRVTGFEALGAPGIVTSASSVGRMTVFMPTSMRISGGSANLSYSGLVGYDGISVSSVTSLQLVQIAGSMISLDSANNATLTTGRPGVLLLNNSTGTYFAVDVEL